MQRTLTELFGAGSETSATTLLFAFLYMIKFPEVQVIFGIINGISMFFIFGSKSFELSYFSFNLLGESTN